MAVDAGSAVGYLDLDISGFMSGLQTAQSQANNATNNLATSMGNTMENVGQKLTSAGSTLTKSVTLPIVAAGTAIITTSANFEEGLSKVEAISGATASEMDQLREKAKEMGATTKFSATEAASAFEYMAMAGWKTEDMLDGIEGIMNLAAASGEDLALTSDIVTDALTAFGMSAKESGHFADILAAASSNANTNVAMLGESFKYVAPVAGAMGYSAEDVSIALGLMANSGIKASNAGTALRTMLTNMAKPTDEMAIAMEDLGVSLDDGEGNMKSFMEIMQDLRKGFGNLKIPQDEFQQSLLELQTAFENGELKEKDYIAMTDDLIEKAYGAEGALKAKAAAALAGKTGMSGLLAIVNSSEEDFEKLTNAIYGASDAYEGQGTAAHMAEVMMDNLKGQLTILKSQLEGVALQLGEILMPHIKKFVGKIQELVTKFSELTPQQQEQIVKFAAIAAAIGPCLVGLGKFISAGGALLKFFGSVGPAMKTAGLALTHLKEGFVLAKAGMAGLGAQASPLGAALGGISAPVLAVVALIATLVAAFKHLWDTNEEFRNKMVGIWDEIVSKVNEFCQGIVDRINALGFDFKDITEVIKTIWESFCQVLAPMFEGVWRQIANLLTAALDIITGIVDIFIGLFTGNWEQCWTGVKEVFGALWQLIVNTFENYMNVFKGVADVVLGWFGISWNEAWQAIKDFFINIWNGVVDFFKGIWDGIISAWTAFSTVFMLLFTTCWNGVKTFFETIFNGVKSFFETIWNGIHDFFMVFWNGLDPEIKQSLLNIVEGIRSAWETAKQIFETVWNVIKEFIISVWNNIKEYISNTMNSICNIISTIMDKVKSIFDTIWTAIVSVVTMLITNIFNSIQNTMSSILNIVSSIMNQIKTTITNILTGVVSYITTFVSSMTTKGTEAANGFFNSIVNGLASLPAKMGQIGADIVNGLWNGIKSGWDWLTDKVADLCDDLMDAAKDALGIHSPSREFAKIGDFCVAGFGKGFDSAWGKTEKSVTASVSGILDKASPKNAADFVVDGITNAWMKFSDMFVSIDNKISESIENIRNSLDSFNKEYVFAADGVGYVGYNSGVALSKERNDDSQSNVTNKGGDTFNFYSQAKLSEAECAKEFRKTKRKIDEGL